MLKSLFSTVLMFLLLSAGLAMAAPYGTVGGTPIDEKNVEKWVQYININPGQGQFKDMRYFGVAQEIKKLLNLALLKKNGITVDNKKLESFTELMEQGAPGQDAFFAKLKEVSGTDRASYIQAFFLLPYTEELLRQNVYSPEKANEFNKDLQQSSNELAKKLAAKPADFTETARKKGYEVKSVTASVTKGIRLTDEKQNALSIASSVPAKEMEDAARSLKEGSVSPLAIANYQYFMIIKAKGKKDGEALLDVMLIPKKVYQDWYWKSVGSIPIKINDPQIRKEIKERAPWAEHLTIK